MIFLPPPTEPVKHTLATSGFLISADMLASGPVTTLSTPGGNFSAMRCTTRAVASGAVSARLHDHGIAGQQRMRQRGAQDGDGPVERHDDADHAQRLVAHGGFGRDVARDRLQHFGGIHLVGMHQRQLPADLQHQRSRPSPRCGPCRSPATGWRRPRRRTDWVNRARPRWRPSSSRRAAAESARTRPDRRPWPRPRHRSRPAAWHEAA